jgi:hypothetical protein
MLAGPSAILAGPPATLAGPPARGLEFGSVVSKLMEESSTT